jgi:hypothetical protein
MSFHLLIIVFSSPIFIYSTTGRRRKLLLWQFTVIFAVLPILFHPFRRFVHNHVALASTHYASSHHVDAVSHTAERVNVPYGHRAHSTCTSRPFFVSIPRARLCAAPAHQPNHIFHTDYFLADEPQQFVLVAGWPRQEYWPAGRGQPGPITRIIRT